MCAIKTKLKSRAGASITFALLIFLVCSVVSVVVIVAASAASGRVSGVQETDQRYYAAVATAETLRDIFEDSDVVEVTYNTDPDTGKPDPSTATVKETSGYALVDEMSVYAVTGQPYNITKDPKYEIKNAAADGYTCTVAPTFGDDLLLSFEIKATGGTEHINIGTYTLTVKFAPNVKQFAHSNDATSAKATVTWQLHSLSKGRAKTTS